MYSRYLATLQWREGEDKVGVLVNKLRIYEDTVTAPFRTHVSSVETRLAEQVRSLIEEGHQKLKKELKEEIYHISPEPTRVSAIRSRYPPARERGYTPRDDSSAVGLLRVEEQQVPIATTTVHRRQYRTDRDSVIPIREMIRKLESQGVVSKACSPFNSPIWPVHMLELQYELESKAAKWYATIDIANAFFSVPLAAECRAQFAFTWKGVQYTWNRLPQGWKHSPTICHGLIQTALEKGEAPEHLQYIDDIIVWGNTAGEVFEKREKIIQILLKAGFAIKQSKVKALPQEIQFLGVKWQDGRRQIPTEVINKITAMSPPTSKKETQAFLGAIGQSPTRRVAQATEGQGGSSQVAELKAIQLALDIAKREKWPTLCLYTDSWMVANALWGWLNCWKKANWQRRGKAIWAAEIWQDMAARVEKLTVKVRHMDAHVSKSQANEEHHNNEQVDKATKVKVSQVIHNCETCAAIKQAKRVKPLWYGGRWLKYRYGEAWQIDYITLPQTRQGKRYVLTMVEATTGWLETYPVPHATARNTILGLEKQVLWRHGTPERMESDNGTHFKNSLLNTWAREHGIEWIHHIPYHAPAAGKVELCNGLLKTTLKALGGGTFKNWEVNLAKATWMVNTRGSIPRAGAAQSEPLHTVDGDKVPVVHMKGILGKTVWINPTSGKGRPIHGIVFAQGPGSLVGNAKTWGNPLCTTGRPNFK
ncbi:hypothetical protein DUI87_32144 [Hirundo rustica rustica]|uniref:ribonuclease H n=1 Tax=Hirundo rustica rustica TaxID=333673 RepID=A0A3M0IX88_HIRRU|nr:hypothetical protein DUI87_32144 [Hirundo rustica rustica]